MYRFLVVLVAVAAARGQYSSFGYSGYPSGFGGASLSHGSFYSQPPPPPSPPIGLGHFGSLGGQSPHIGGLSQSSFGYGDLSGLSSLGSEYYHQKPISYGSSGDYSDRSQFESGKRGQNDQKFAAQNGRQGEEFQENSNGFKQGNAGARNVKEDSGFFSGENGEKRFSDDGKHYFGDKSFEQEGNLH